MIIADKYKFVFVHIPKTGGTSIKHALYNFYDGQIEFDGERVTDLDGYRPHIAMTKDLSSKCKGYFKFGFVRNPWSWHASIWRFFNRPDRNNRFITGISFSAYIDLICNTETSLPYIKNQIDWVSENGELTVDFIGRFEHLSRDFELILDRIDLNKKTIKLPHYKNNGPYEYRGLYNNNTREMIAIHNKRDIEAFGYTF